jgi:hypothetical protein
MAGKADQLARRYEDAVANFISDVEGLSDADLRAKTDVEGWTVAACAHHAATASAPLASMAQAAAMGGPMPPITQAMLDEMNAKHAQDFAACSREETLAAIREQAPAAAQVVRGLSDEQLGRAAELPFGMTMTAEQIIENVLIGHLVGHSQSIRAVTAAA